MLPHRCWHSIYFRTMTCLNPPDTLWCFMPSCLKWWNYHLNIQASMGGALIWDEPLPTSRRWSRQPVSKAQVFWVLVVLGCWGHGSNNFIIVYDDKSAWGYLGWFWTMSITMRWVVDAILSVKASKHFGQPQWKPPCWSMCWHMMGFQPWLLCRTLGTKLF